MYACEGGCGAGPVEARRGRWNPCCWRSGGSAPPSLGAGLLQEQQALLTTEHLSSPLISILQIRSLRCNFMMNIGFVI